MSSQPTETERVPALITTGLVTVSVIFPVLSLICVFFRYKARRATRAPLLADDWWILASWVFSLFLSIDVWVVGSITGIDYYKIDPAEGIQDSVIALCVSGVVTQVALTLVKIGVLFYYKRIFPGPKFAIAVWIGIVITACWGITLFFVSGPDSLYGKGYGAYSLQLLMFQGDTVKGTFRGTARWVVDTTQLGLAQAWTSIVLDVMILCYPLPMIFSLRMKPGRKVAIALIFWLGLFCCVAAAVRSALVKQNIEKVSESAGLQIHSEYMEIIFVIIEPNCSIIAACLPCYVHLLNRGSRLETLLQSARSIFSLQSLRTGTRTSPGATQANEPVSDSRVELGHEEQNWPDKQIDTQISGRDIASVSSV
ncbi:hypothetical protein F5Y13DRAFT_197921 [Hypoxylon sp. FL1857]|nr:hypothetical protein F5Y13DRAFT_197921 [Hypoxylon sp. FL1857]